MDDCRAYLEQVQQQQEYPQQVDAVGRWQATVATTTQVAAAVGHTMAVLARHTGHDADWHTAQRRLVAAAAGFDPATQTRARALATARLATARLATARVAIVHLDLDQPVPATAWAQQTLAAHAQLRSTRLNRYLQAIATTAQIRNDDPRLKQLAEDITEALQPPPPRGLGGQHGDHAPG